MFSSFQFQNLGRLSAYVSRVMSMLESLQGLVSQNRDKSKTLDLGLEMLIEALQRAHVRFHVVDASSHLGAIYYISSLLLLETFNKKTTVTSP